MSEQLITARMDDAEEAISYAEKLQIDEIVKLKILDCNRTIFGDPMIFEGNVRALYYLLPKPRKLSLEKRTDEYVELIDDWEYQEVCGVKAGTPANPITLDGEPANEDWGNVISPIPIQREEYDYEKLYELILEEFQGTGMTWSSMKKTIELGKNIQIQAPGSVVKLCEQAIIKILIQARRDEPLLTFDMIIEDLRYAMPRTPKLKE